LLGGTTLFDDFATPQRHAIESGERPSPLSPLHGELCVPPVRTFLCFKNLAFFSIRLGSVQHVHVLVPRLPRWGFSFASGCLSRPKTRISQRTAPVIVAMSQRKPDQWLVSSSGRPSASKKTPTTRYQIDYGLWVRGGRSETHLHARTCGRNAISGFYGGVDDGATDPTFFISSLFRIASSLSPRSGMSAGSEGKKGRRPPIRRSGPAIESRWGHFAMWGFYGPSMERAALRHRGTRRPCASSLIAHCIIESMVLPHCSCDIARRPLSCCRKSLHADLHTCTPPTRWYACCHCRRTW